jgi:hypothetical protein
MSEAEHALDLLAGLSATDRNWIVQRLSAEARSRLMASAEGPAARGSPLSADDPAASRSPSGAANPSERSRSPAGTGAIERLIAADPDRLGFLLQTEPAWLVCAVLHAHPWPWGKQVLQSLPAPLRAEIARLERHGTALSKPAMQVLLDELARQLGPRPDGGNAPSGFESVLMRVRRLRRA